ncbi:hypothetical protein [Candidatus Tisiphia endosymbiont of Oplodontha viridula]|uniref:hypothetical protein n=1 Tax=Candidatus Tisiphia endosymbiont of Oplodontha viridula TaxID=3077925 RepID=UPI0035C8CAAD
MKSEERNPERIITIEHAKHVLEQSSTALFMKRSMKSANEKAGKTLIKQAIERSSSDSYTENGSSKDEFVHFEPIKDFLASHKKGWCHINSESKHGLCSENATPNIRMLESVLAKEVELKSKPKSWSNYIKEHSKAYLLPPPSPEKSQSIELDSIDMLKKIPGLPGASTMSTMGKILPKTINPYYFSVLYCSGILSKSEEILHRQVFHFYKKPNDFSMTAKFYDQIETVEITGSTYDDLGG